MHRPLSQPTIELAPQRFASSSSLHSFVNADPLNPSLAHPIFSYPRSNYDDGRVCRQSIRQGLSAILFAPSLLRIPVYLPSPGPFTRSPHNHLSQLNHLTE